MSSIDRRIVEMKFDNSQFERGIKSTLDALEQLKSGLKIGEGKDNLAKGMDSSGIAENVDKIAGRFGTLGAAWATVVQGITRSAMDLGGRLVGAIWDPINEGGKKRALNLEQARFQFEGLGMDVEATMASALAAVKGTAFGLDEAAVAAANFGATGMRAGEEMTNALTGISGVAAMSGSSYADVASIFGKVAGQGRLMGDDLNRLAARGINAAATLAEQMGVTETEIREMVSEGKISFNDFASSMNDAFGKHATKANETYSGSLANMRAALARIGAAVHGPRLKNMRDIFNGITPVIDEIASALKPMNIALEQAGKLGSERLVGWLENLDLSYLPKIIASVVRSAQNLYKAFMSVVGPIRDAIRTVFPPATKEEIFDFVRAIERFTESLILSEQKVGYLKRTIAGLLAPFKILWELIKVVGAVLRAVFEPIFEMLGFAQGGILGITANFGDWLVVLSELVTNANLAEKAYNAVSGAIGPFMNWLRKLIKTVREYVGLDTDQIFDGFEEGIKNAIDWLKLFLTGPIDNLERAMEGPKQAFESFRDGAKDAITDVINTIQALTGEAKSGAADGMATGLSGMQRVGEVLLVVWEKVKSVFSDIWDTISGIGEAIGDAFSGVWDAIQDVMGRVDPNVAMGTLNLGMVVGAIIAIKEIISDMGTNFLGNISWSISEFASTLEAMQKDLIAGAILKIAAAILVLAVSLYIVSKIPADKLVSSGIALLAFIGAMVGAVALLDNIKNPTKVAALSAALILLGGALFFFALAGAKFAEMDPEELITALVGLAGALAASNLARKGQLDALALFALGAAFFTIAKALQQLEQTSWESLGKGAAVIGALMAVMWGMEKMKITGAGLVNAAIAIGILGVSLMIMGKAMGYYTNISWDIIADGLAKMGLTLLVLVAAMRAFPATGMIGAAVSIGIMAIAMGLMSKTLEKFADFDGGDIAASLGMLAGTLAILAGAMYLMTGALPGALALLTVSAALLVMLPVLLAFSNLDGDSLGMILGTLASVLGVIALGGMLLIPALPGLMGLGVAAALIGVGAMAAGLGLLWMGAGLTAVGLASTSLIPMIYAIANTIPTVAAKLAEGFVMFMDTIARLAPTLHRAFVAIWRSIIDSLEVVVPEVIDLMVEMLEKLLVKIEEHMPALTEAGMGILLSFLEGVEKDINAVVDAGMRIIEEYLRGIGDNIQDVIDEGVYVLEQFLEGIEDAIPGLADSGSDVVIAFVEAIGDNTYKLATAAAEMILDLLEDLRISIDYYAPQFRTQGRLLAGAIINGMTGGLAGGLWKVGQSAWNLGAEAVKKAKEALSSNSPSKKFIEIGGDTAIGFAIGMDRLAHRVHTSSAHLGEGALYEVKKTMIDIAKAVDSDVDMQPVIRPVLDLSGVQRDARKIGEMLNVRQLDTSMDLKRAEQAYLQPEEDEDDEIMYDPESGEFRSVQFVQNNYSPESLSETTIYRRTRNQISQFKELIDSYDSND